MQDLQDQEFLLNSKICSNNTGFGDYEIDNPVGWAQVTPRSRGRFFQTGLGLFSLQFQTRMNEGTKAFPLPI